MTIQEKRRERKRKQNQKKRLCIEYESACKTVDDRIENQKNSRNAEGYIDTTATAAIRKVGR